jgi:hypothetical protein
MKQKYLLVKGCAGLGNRIRSLLSAIDYAKKNNRLLIIDWSDGQYFEKTLNFFDDYFVLDNIDYLSPAPEEIAKLCQDRKSFFPSTFAVKPTDGIYDHFMTVHNELMIRISFRLFKKTKLCGYWLEKRFIKDTNKLSLIKYVYNSFRKNSFHLGANLPDNLTQDVVIFADYTPPLLPNLLRQHFKLNIAFQSKLEKIGNALNIEKCIAVHVRATDLMPTKDVQEIINHLKIKHPESPIFLATDSLKIEILFNQNLKYMRMTSKSASKDGIAMHVSSALNNYNNAKESFESSLLDLYLLSKAKILYYQGNSSYSQIALALRSTDSIDWLKL